MGLRDRQGEMAAAIEEVMALHNIQVDALAKQMAGEEGDFTGLLAQCEQRLEEMKLHADDLLQKTGMTKEELENYSSNRANFSPAEWEMLENTRKACEEIRERDNKILQSHIPKEVLERAEKPKVRRKKRKGVKKKDWIQL